MGFLIRESYESFTGENTCNACAMMHACFKTLDIGDVPFIKSMQQTHTVQALMIGAKVESSCENVPRKLGEPRVKW